MKYLQGKGENENHSLKLIIRIVLISVLVNSYTAYSQKKHVRKIDRINSQKETKKYFSMKNRFTIGVNYGQWYFAGSSKIVDNETIIIFPGNSGVLKFYISYWFLKHFSLKLNLNYFSVKDVPPRPDIGSILDGEDINIEGSGAGMIPLSLNLQYSFFNKKFRPYVLAGAGIVAAQSQHTKVTGNISNGINREDFEQKEKAYFCQLGSGISYCPDKYVKYNLNINYSLSADFNEPIAGMKNCRGFDFSAGIELIIGR